MPSGLEYGYYLEAIIRFLEIKDGSPEPGRCHFTGTSPHEHHLSDSRRVHMVFAQKQRQDFRIHDLSRQAAGNP